MPTRETDTPASASEPPRRTKILPILFVLIIGTEYPFYLLSRWIVPIVSHRQWSPLAVSSAGTIVTQAIIVIVILLVVHYWERLPMRSVGIFRLAFSDLYLGIGAFVAILLIEMASTPLLVWILTAGRGSHGLGIAAIDPRQVALIAQWPWPTMIAVAVTAGVFEELWARGYGIERLEALTGSTIAAAVVTLALDLGAHVPFWGIRYAILIAPIQVVLLALYLWRRRIAPCVIAHAMTDAARPIFLGAIWILPLILPMHITRGALAFSKGHYDEAITEYSIALRRSPNDIEALEGRSDAYWYQGKYDQSIEDLTKIIKLTPDNEDAYRNRANSYFSKSDYPHAMTDVNRATELAPDDPDAYSLRADIDAALGDGDREIRDLGDTIRLNPRDRDAIERRERIFYDRGDYDRAIADLNRAIALDPKSASAYGSRAIVSYRQHQYRAAIDDSNNAIALKPDNSSFYEVRAAAYMKLGKPELARADWKHILSGQPKTAYDYNEHAWILATCPLADIRNGARAVELATAGCEASGWKDSDSLDTLAAAYAELGDFRNASLWEKKAIAALSTSKATVAEEMRKRLTLYETGHSYRDSTLAFD